jgi:hypothetical protein
MSLRSGRAILTAGLWLAGGVLLTGCSVQNPLYDRVTAITNADAGATPGGPDAGTPVPNGQSSAPEIGSAQEPPSSPGDAAPSDGEAMDIPSSATDNQSDSSGPDTQSVGPAIDAGSVANPDGQGDAGTLTDGGAAPATPPLNQSFDGQNLRLYINGVLAAAPLAYARPLIASPYPLYVGTNKNPNSADQPFEGVLDEVLLYSEALDDDTIAKIRNGNVPLR